MKLAEAIRIKENYLKLHASELYKEIVEADQMSIGALKAVEGFRTGKPTPALWQLPGETKE